MALFLKKMLKRPTAMPDEIIQPPGLWQAEGPLITDIRFEGAEDRTESGMSTTSIKRVSSK